MQNKYYIKEHFYFDFDNLNQLRIAGPGNHLFMGWSFPENLRVILNKYDFINDQLEIELEIESSALRIHCPIVTDIRTIRDATESVKPRITYTSLVHRDRSDLLPQIIKIKRERQENIILLKNTYEGVNNINNEYGVEVIFSKDINVSKKGNNLNFYNKLSENIIFKIRTINNISSNINVPDFFIHSELLPNKHFSDFLTNLYDESGLFIEHLIKNNKTSSFEYGTIFPRDWMESADLGSGNFSTDTIDYIYSKVLENISETGEGWHEDIIGQYKNKKNKEIQDDSKNKAIIDRKMIDIEPHYILGLKYVSSCFLLNDLNSTRIVKVARYIVEKANELDLISFKSIAGDQYHSVGNWRDSSSSFPNQKPPLSPYDVNCVFYPMSLRIIREYNDLFHFDSERLNTLVDKWDAQKEKFKIYHPYNLIGYSIALYGQKNKPMPVSHLDESYNLFYGMPSINDVDSFAKKIISPNYFYTPVGPILVSSDEDEFSTYNYHGKVIWPKQVAFSVAGLTRQYKIGINYGWPDQILKQIRESILLTCEASFRGWEEMGYVPELYYYDDKLNRARLYSDQNDYEGQMSNIQLWSSVAVRRIMQDYNYILSN